MRLLLPAVLLAAALGAAYLFLNRGPATEPAGAGPDARSAAATDGKRPSVDLAAGNASTRAPVPSEATPAAAAGTPQRAADTTIPSEPLVPEKDPEFVGGATADPVGTAVLGTADYYAAKYGEASRESRVQSLEALRAALEFERQSQSKDSNELTAEMKREIDWLQSHSDG